MEDPSNAVDGSASSNEEATKIVQSRLETATSNTADVVRWASSAVAVFGTEAAELAKSGLCKIEENHGRIADHADTLAKATRVAAGVAAAGAAVAAPSGLAAIGVALGVVSAPLVVTAAPILVAVAGGALTISAAASLYSKSRRKRSKRENPDA